MVSEIHVVVGVRIDTFAGIQWGTRITGGPLMFPGRIPPALNLEPAIPAEVKVDSSMSGSKAAVSGRPSMRTAVIGSDEVCALAKPSKATNKIKVAKRDFRNE